MNNTAYIPSKEEHKRVVEQAVRDTIINVLPEAIRKANQKEWLSTNEVMEILDCSRRHVQHLRDSGQIVFYQQGRSIRYKYSDIIAYLNKGKVGGGQ